VSTPPPASAKDRLQAKDSFNPVSFPATSKFYPRIESFFTGKTWAKSSTAETTNQATFSNSGERY
jgi:hypothetical protein